MRRSDRAGDALRLWSFEEKRLVSAGLVRSTLDYRVQGIVDKSRRFPGGTKMPPHLSPLLPDRMFPPSREVPSPIHPLFPPPSPFPQDPARYILPDHSYMGNQVSTANSINTSTQSVNMDASPEVNTMSNISPSYALDAPHEKSFFCVNGEKYKNLRDLHVGLLTMKDEHFRHHVNDAKNDFARWVADVFADNALAKEMTRVRSRALSAYKVGQRVKHVRTRHNI